jgi:hypothetical protein
LIAAAIVAITIAAAVTTPGAETNITDPVKNRITGTWSLFLGRRLTASDGTFLGIVSAPVELRYLEDFYRRIAPQADREAADERQRHRDAGDDRPAKPTASRAHSIQTRLRERGIATVPGSQTG